MSRFIQVNKLYKHQGRYRSSQFDSLLNTEDISEINPRSINENMNEAFENKNACFVLMKNGEGFYILGSFSDVKSKIAGDKNDNL